MRAKKVYEGIEDVLKPHSKEDLLKMERDEYLKLDKLAEDNPDYYVKYLDPKKNDGKKYALIFRRVAIWNGDTAAYNKRFEWKVKLYKFHDFAGQSPINKWSDLHKDKNLLNILYPGAPIESGLGPKFPDSLNIINWGGKNWQIHGTKKPLKEIYDEIGDRIIDIRSFPKPPEFYMERERQKSKRIKNES
jgi:hypothetical protein